MHWRANAVKLCVSPSSSLAEPVLLDWAGRRTQLCFGKRKNSGAAIRSPSSLRVIQPRKWDKAELAYGNLADRRKHGAEMLYVCVNESPLRSWSRDIWGGRSATDATVRRGSKQRGNSLKERILRRAQEEWWLSDVTDEDKRWQKIKRKRKWNGRYCARTSKTVKFLPWTFMTAVWIRSKPEPVTIIFLPPLRRKKKNWYKEQHSKAFQFIFSHTKTSSEGELQEDRHGSARSRSPVLVHVANHTHPSAFNCTE